MTTDTQLAPTDAEIDALWALLTSAAVASPSKFAREVLARWGAQQMPASAAEFALCALVAAGHVAQERVDQALALPGAPQPMAIPQDMRYVHGGVSERGNEIKRAVDVVSELERRGMLEARPSAPTASRKEASMALTPEQIDKLAEHVRTNAEFARAIEAEVRKDDEALIWQMLKAIRDMQGYRADIDAAIAAARARLEQPCA